MIGSSIAPSDGKSTAPGRAVIVGTGYLARVIADSFADDHGDDGVLGFVALPSPLDWAAPGTTPSGEPSLHGRPVFGVAEALARWGGGGARILIGSDDRAGVPIPTWRRTVFHALRARGLRAGGFVHSAAWVLGGTTIDPSAIILADAYVEPLVTVGRNAVLEGNAFVSQHSSVGAHCHLETSALVAGQVTIHAEVTVGTNATLRSGVTLCRGSHVGCGAIVQRDLHPFETVAVRPPSRPFGPSAP
ncbi:hypothetical protein KAJ83_10505 [Marivibrio halodurans]|uniref:Sugar O-acyltransferase, sialic acid O-acetyltransferase NeuD family n=1 Tax=Marivibrio halodurans TaxID=2039722 RepID=A0A8J7S642_9PROT|nr:hypothetical protein [Marivibrio halodurans]MBP5857439.1 hypothetical protein [Marivibrio halodurans]